jgi:hypothetical protein
MTREQLEDALKCHTLACDKCLANDKSRNCMPRVAKTALDLMDKLERAEQLFKDLTPCYVCKHYKVPSTKELVFSELCRECINFNGSKWEFNEELLVSQEDVKNILESEDN